jgi:MoxR-like ATPase
MTHNTNNTAQFQGQYVHNLRDIFVGAALSGVHAIVVGAPGFGKTDIALSLGRRISPKGTIFTRFAPSTPPEKVQGPVDPSWVLNPDGNEMRYVTAGTPYDPKAQIVVLDEVFRANDVAFDILLDVTDRKDIPRAEAPSCWATCNFIVASDRLEALRDRFGLWHYMPDTINVSTQALVKAQLSASAGLNELAVPGNAPTWEEILEIRETIPGPKAINAIVSIIDDLEMEAFSAEFPLRVSPRRKTQWSRILHCASTYIGGSTNYETIPSDAAKLLQYATPALDAGQAAQWAAIAQSVVDTVGSAIEGFLAELYEAIKGVSKETDPAKLTETVSQYTQIIARAEENMKSIAPNDPRVGEALAKAQKWLGKALQGELLEE